MKSKHPVGPPMTLGNMRELDVQRLIVSCLNDASRYTALIDVSSHPTEIEVPSLGDPGGRSPMRAPTHVAELIGGPGGCLGFIR
jgi:hypothetical protein